MKKLILLIITLLLISGCNKKNEPFYLDDKYYGESEFIQIDNNELKTLENNKASFVIVVYNNNCIGSSNFIKVVNEYLESNDIKIYKILGKNVNGTEISKKLKYYPSMVIYKEGKIINYLDTSKDSDLKYYENVIDFKEWFHKQILLR